MKTILRIITINRLKWIVVCIFFLLQYQMAIAQIADHYSKDKGIGFHSDVLLFTDFENSTWKDDWVNWGGGNPLAVDSNNSEKFTPLDGKALEVMVPEEQHTGMSLIYQFLENTGSEPEEIYFRYYLRLGDGWSPTSDGKFPGIAGTYGNAGWGGRLADGYNGWSARGLFQSPRSAKTPIGNYVYHIDESSNRQWGEHILWGSGASASENSKALLENNRWYCIEMFVKMNTPGKYDGTLRGWIDGEPVFERTNLRFRDTRDLKIETIWLNLYHGGSLVAPSDQILFIDNIVVAKSYIGPKS